MNNRRTLILSVILFLTAINFFYILWFYESYRYLPPPFIFDKENTFMDFYNTLYWSGQDGIYSAWQSVYPPVNFQFLKIYQLLFMEESHGIGDGFDIRQKLGVNIYPLIAIYIASLFIAVRIGFKKLLSIKIQLIVFLICLFSPPFLFAVERGNLIILAIPVLSWYMFSKSQVSRSLALALLVNLKPYFVILFIIKFLNVKSHKENEDFLFLAPVLSMIIFFVTGLMLNQEFYLMPINLLGFATNSTLLSPSDVLSFPSSIAAVSYLRGLITEYKIPPFIGYLAKLIIYVYIIKSIILIYKNKVDFNDLSIFSIILITNYSVSTGGYGILYYIPVIGLLYQQKNYSLLTIIISSMYIGIWDLIPIYHYSVADMNVYLSGDFVRVEPYITLGSIIRPLANFVVLVLFFRILKERYLYEKT